MSSVLGTNMVEGENQLLKLSSMIFPNSSTHTKNCANPSMVPLKGPSDKVW